MFRLTTISKELSVGLTRAAAEKQREVVVRSCEYVIKKTKTNSRLILDILQKYSNKSDLPLNLRTELEKEIAIFEEEYFRLQAAEETGECSQEEYLIPFQKARAISAVLYCFESDLELASNEALYEAAMSLDDPEELIDTIKKVLSKL